MNPPAFFNKTDGGKLVERLNTPVLKTGSPSRGSRVRIPRFPPSLDGISKPPRMLFFSFIKPNSFSAKEIMAAFFEKGFFSRKQEVFLASFSGLCILAGIIEIFYFYNMAKSTRDMLQFLYIFFLLNELHIFLTPLLLLSTEGGRQFLTEAQQEFNFTKKLFWGCLIFFVGIFILLYLVKGWSVNWAIGFVVCWSQFHAARQSMGMSIIYRRLTGDAAEYNMRWDQKLFAPIAFTFVLFYIFLTYDRSSYHQISPYFSIATLLFVVIYFISPIFRGAKLWSWARFYDLRLLVYPLAIQGSFFVLAIHGVEYLFISQKFFAGEKKLGTIFKTTFWTFLILSLIMVTFRSLTIDLTSVRMREWVGIPWLVSLLISISLTFKVFHFWADGYLFTRKNLSSKTWILSRVGHQAEVGKSANGV